jgi:hypothetical protein
MTCKLCLQDKPLRNSHIIPEFLYKHEKLYDDKYRYLRLSLDPTNPNVYEHKGRREELLCTDCENLLNQRYERYARQVLYDKRQQHSTQTPSAEILNNLDYARLKLFQLSILWRASMSSLPEFNSVTVGPHEERIRQMLLDGNPGAVHEYGCLMLDPETETEVEHYGAFEPSTVQQGGYMGISFIFGGLLWIYVVSDQLEYFQDQGRFVSLEGTVMIAKDTDGAAKQFLDRVVAKARTIEEQRQTRADRRPKEYEEVGRRDR